MAFWGIEVRPGKPYTHRYDDARGRLRISQATLGIGNVKGGVNGTAARSVLQCNVGEKSPILLCSLIAEKVETCHLELEFEESEDVVFSVVGPRSVHLSGYFIGAAGCCRDGDETDSYGEDIGEEDSDDSLGSFGREEDDYESDFIDDDDMEMFSPSLRANSGVVIEEIIDDDKPTIENGARRRLKKKYQLSDTEDVDSSGQLVKSNTSPPLESEDEDGFPICISLKRKTDVDSVADDKTSGDKTIKDDKKRKVDTICKHDESSRGTSQLDGSSLPSEDGETNASSKKKKKVKDGKATKTVSKLSSAETVTFELKSAADTEVVGEGAEERHVAEVEIAMTESEQKPKKKNKKEKANKGKTSQNGRTSDGLDGSPKADPDEVVNVDGMDQSHPSEVQEGEESRRKTKKNKKQAKDEHGQFEKATNDNSDLDVDLSVKKSPTEKHLDDNSVPQLSDKKKGKKAKNKNHDDTVKTNEKMAEAKEELIANKTRTFANGLVVEELSMGKPDGKKASAGKKVFVSYIGKLKSGKIFDSNIGGKPFRFRLGIGEVIKGWDVGVNGMRVGDKRRLTIPPSMGYGNKNLPQIPANSWLLFDVELVDVK